MGRECGMHGEEKCIRGLVDNLRKSDHLEDGGIGEKILLKCISKK
jgi:hypothetical protein